MTGIVAAVDAAPGSRRAPVAIPAFAAMNAVWESWVVPAQTPARATVQAKLAGPDYRIEVQVVAAL